MFGENLVNVMSFIGISAFSASGAMIGIKKGADLFGVMFLASITATGGGILRDILLGSLPPYIFLNPHYIFVSVIVSLILFFLARHFPDKYCEKSQFIENANNIFDALGLGVFVALGTKIAIDNGFTDNMFPAVAIGTVTGVGGGFLRDIMVLQMPLILRKHIYATAAIIGSLVFYLFHPVNYKSALIMSTAVTFSIRMISSYFNLNLPRA